MPVRHYRQPFKTLTPDQQRRLDMFVLGGALAFGIGVVTLVLNAHFH